jgi:tryptophan 2,3-dioxygenase
MSKPLTYINYLKVDDLLQLQTPRSNPEEHDEMLFITIHQVYELWFKQLLHEIDYAMRRLLENDTTAALHTLNRVRTILKTVVAQIDVLETMTPLEFNSFRSFLESASGFQSIQFRELEFVLGHKRETLLKHFPPQTFHHDELDRRYKEPTLWDAFLAYLQANGYAVPTEHLNRDVTQGLSPSPQLQALLIEVYRTDDTVRGVCERLVDLDEGLQEWRYRHVKMVQRTIGMKQGTGGSPGVKYLESTISAIFPDLWAIRSEL